MRVPPLSLSTIVYPRQFGFSIVRQGLSTVKKATPRKDPCLTSAPSTCIHKQSILEYNGGACVAMVGKNCVAIAR